MKYMGWSWSDLQAAPAHIVSEVISIVNEESAAIEAARSS